MGYSLKGEWDALVESRREARSQRTTIFNEAKRGYPPLFCNASCTCSTLASGRISNDLGNGLPAPIFIDVRDDHRRAGGIAVGDLPADPRSAPVTSVTFSLSDFIVYLLINRC